MDPKTVDSLAKLVGSGQSRRRILRTLAGGALASVATAIGLNRTDAAKVRSVGNSCTQNSDCASGLCVQEGRTRKICHCRSNGDCPAGGVCLVSGSCCAPASQTMTCSGLCGTQTNNCGQSVDCGPCCTALLGACAADQECCTGTCQNNLCCKGPGVSCTDDSDCCGIQYCVSGACCASNDPTITCQGTCGTVLDNCGIPVDCGPCTCTLATASAIDGPPTQEEITIQDTTHGGIQSIIVTQSDNADTPVPPFTVGTTDPVTVMSTKIDQSQSSSVAVQITTVNGYSETCSYVF